MHGPPRHHYPGHYRHRVWAVNGLTVTALGLIGLSAMAAAGQRAGDAITPAVQAVPPPPTVSQPTGVLELITAPSTTASTAVATDGGKNGPEPTRACRCQPRQPLTVEPPSATTGPPTALSASVTASTTPAGLPTTPTRGTTAPSLTKSSTPPSTSSSPATTPATSTPATSTATTTAATSEAVLSTQATAATSEETAP